MHFIVPYIISILALVHILSLHQVDVGSSNPLVGVKESIMFSSYFGIKELNGLITASICFYLLNLIQPNYFWSSANFISAS